MMQTLAKSGRAYQDWLAGQSRVRSDEGAGPYPNVNAYALTPGGSSTVSRRSSTRGSEISR